LQAAWQHGRMAAWQNGSMAALQHCSSAAWQHGSTWQQDAESIVAWQQAAGSIYGLHNFKVLSHLRTLYAAQIKGVQLGR